MKRISQDEEFSPEVNLEMFLVLKDLLLYLKVNEFSCVVYDEIWYIGNRHDERSGHLHSCNSQDFMHTDGFSRSLHLSEKISF